MITLRVACPAPLTEDVERRLGEDPLCSALVITKGAMVDPPGDLIEADYPREAVNDVVDDLVRMGVQREGTIKVMQVDTWVSERGLRTMQEAPGASADAVVWSQVVERAYDESSLTFTYLAFMILATLLAAIAVATDSPILVIGAMVLGPEFVPIAAIGLGAVRHRFGLVRLAASTLVIGFAVSISAVALLSWLAKISGLVTAEQIDTQSRVGTSFIYSPSVWSLIVAIIAGAAGVLALTSAKSGGLVGVFISVTTIPASGNIAIASVFGLWEEVWGSTVTLVANIGGMVLAGWLTLAIQQALWKRAARSGRRIRGLGQGQLRSDHLGQ